MNSIPKNTKISTLIGMPHKASGSTRWKKALRRTQPLAGSVAALCAAVAIGQSIAPSAFGATQTWTGTTDANWATGSANWNGTSPSSGDSLVFTSSTGAGGLTLIDNLMTPATYNIAGITFSAAAPAFVINSGTAGTNGFTLTGNIINSGTNLQIINDKIAVNGTRNLTTSAGGGNITLGGAVTNGPLVVSGSGTLTLSGNLDNSFLIVNVQGGTVNLAKTANNAVAGFSGISSGAKVVLINSNQIYGGNSSNQGVHGLEGTLDMNGKTESVSWLDGVAGTVDNSAAGTAALTVGESNVTTTFGGTIKNSGGALSLTKTGTGTLTLSGSNSYSGGTTVSSGALLVSGSGTLGAAAGNLSMSGGALNLGATVQAVGAVSITTAPASGNTIQNGTLTGTSFSASNTSGTVVVSANLAGTGATLTMSGNGGTLLLTGSNSYTGSVSVTNGTLILAGDNTSAGAMSNSGGGKIQIGNGGTAGTLGSGAVTVNGNGLLFNRTDPVSAPLVVNNAVTSGVIVVNSGAVQLGGSADNSYLTADIKGGATLILAKATSSVHALNGATVESGGTLIVGGSNTGAQVYGGATVTVNSGGVFDLNGNSENCGLAIAGAGIGNGGAFINSSTSASSTFAHAVTLNGDTFMGGAGNLTVSGAISGAYGVVKTGSGTMTLSGANAINGATVSQGTLKATNSTALGAGLGAPIAINNPLGSGTVNGANAAATLDLAGVTVSNSIVLNGGTNGASLINSNASTASTVTGGISGVQFTSAPINLSVGTTAVLSGGGGSGATAQLGLTTASVASLSSGTGYKVNDVLTVTGGGGTGAQLLVTGTGAGGSISTWSLKSAGTGFTGVPTGVSGGNGSGASLSAVDGNFTLVSLTETAAGSGYTSAPSVSLSGGTGFTGSTALTAFTLVGTNNSIGGAGNLTIAAPIADGTSSGGFTKTGSGSLTLSGSNTFTGGVIVGAGELKVGSAGAFNAVPGSESTVAFGPSSTGTLTLNGNSVTVANLTSNPTPGTPIVQNGVSGTATLTVGNSLNLSGTYAGTIMDGAGALSLVKAGGGTLTLTGSVGNTGGTSVNSGTLQFGDGVSSTSVSAGTVTVTSPGVMAINLANSGTFAGYVINHGTVNLLNSGTNTISGNLTGWVSSVVNQTGTGTTVLTGNNTCFGTFNINAGTVALNSQYAGADLTFNQAVPNSLVFGVTNPVIGGLSGTNGINLVTTGGSGVNLSIGYSNFDSSYSGVVAGGSGSGLTKIGSGTLTLSASNSYAGPITVSAGVLKAGNANALGSGTVTLSGGTLDLNGNAIANPFGTATAGGILNNGAAVTLNQSFSGACLVSGSGDFVLGGAVTIATLNIGGPGKVTLAGNADNSWLSADIKGGATLILAKATSSVHALNGATVESGGALIIGGSNTGAQVYTLATVTVNSGGVFDLNGNNENCGLAIAGAGIGNGGAFINSSTSASSAFAHAVTLNGDTSMGGAGNLTVSGAISGAYGVVKTGSGSLTLSGSNTFNGVTGLVIQSGTVIASSNAAALGGSGTGTVTLGNTIGASVASLLVSTNGLTYANPIALPSNASAGTLTIGTYGTGISTTFTGGVTGTNNLVINANGTNGTITFSTNAVNNVGTVTNTGPGTGATTIAVIGSNVTEVRQNSATSPLILTGSNAYAGATTVNAGTLKISGSSNLGDGSTTNRISLGTGTLESTGNSYDLGLNRSINLTGAGTIQVDGGVLTLSGAITNGGNLLTIAGNGSAIVAGTISGAGGLSKTGGGTLTLTASNSYSGGTTISAGAVQLTTDAQLGAVPGSPAVNITLNGGGLYNNGSSPTLNANRTVYLGANGGGIAAGWSQAFTVNGRITGPGGLRIVWNGGPVVLTSTANDYAGDTTIGVSGAGQWPGPVLLRLGADNVLPYGAGKGNVVFGTYSTYAPTLDLNGHNVQIDGLSASNTYAIVDNMAGTGTYRLTVGNNDQSSTFAGAIKNTTGQIAMIKTGAGTLTLSGSNSYSGGTTVSNGTLQVGNAKALGTGGLTVNNGTLDLNNTSVSVGALSGSAGMITNTVSGTSTLITSVATGTSTYAGNILNGTGAVALTNSGAGTLILSGSLTMAGLNADGGVTQLTQSGSIGAVSVASGATLSMAANSGGNRTVLNLSSLTISGFTSGLALTNSAPLSTPAPALLNADNVTGASTSMLAAAGQTAVASAPAVEPASAEAVPEPGSLGLLLAGALGMLGIRRQRRNN